MAVRGAKPKPAHLKVVEGNPGNRDIQEDFAVPLDQSEPPKFERPKYLRTKKAKQLWDEASKTCWWLHEADGYKLGMWCALQAEFETKPADMVASRIAQLRVLGSELGMDPAARIRMGAVQKPKKKDEFFD